jgi:hypothetical protein
VPDVKARALPAKARDLASAIERLKLTWERVLTKP